VRIYRIPKGKPCLISSTLFNDEWDPLASLIASIKKPYSSLCLSFFIAEDNFSRVVIYIKKAPALARPERERVRFVLIFIYKKRVHVSFILNQL
jgi:hypothetical protein